VQVDVALAVEEEQRDPDLVACGQVNRVEVQIPLTGGHRWVVAWGDRGRAALCVVVFVAVVDTKAWRRIVVAYDVVIAQGVIVVGCVIVTKGIVITRCIIVPNGIVITRCIIVTKGVVIARCVIVTSGVVIV